MRRKINKNDNLLELIPLKNEKFDWKINEEGLVQVIILRNSMLDRIVRVFFNTPKFMKIDLDKYGSFIWNCIDGTKNIEEIGQKFKEKFGEEVEPLYERLVTYINILRNNKFIKLVKESDIND
ncbi:PqqD family protein [Caldisalinibacter kiritimatiensis]|uniref:Coenzyme PQQ synthesis protein D (PqqD) n=1 Tax=Caldisalinibacter kiritimatiensis TaxID=1304284 RepID=R1AVU5_9FIRM|nr:PqqD family protein [Caldisalinibacter kiritimatiensis]EOD00777.1 hypothetical protein L21TH_1148 [Caldisalinibacter kiritimatiensis]